MMTNKMTVTSSVSQDNSSDWSPPPVQVAQAASGAEVPSVPAFRAVGPSNPPLKKIMKALHELPKALQEAKISDSAEKEALIENLAVAIEAFEKPLKARVYARQEAISLDLNKEGFRAIHLAIQEVKTCLKDSSNNPSAVTSVALTLATARLITALEENKLPYPFEVEVSVGYTTGGNFCQQTEEGAAFGVRQDSFFSCSSYATDGQGSEIPTSYVAKMGGFGGSLVVRNSFGPILGAEAGIGFAKRAATPTYLADVGSDLVAANDAYENAQSWEIPLHAAVVFATPTSALFKPRLALGLDYTFLLPGSTFLMAGQPTFNKDDLLKPTNKGIFGKGVTEFIAEVTIPMDMVSVHGKVGIPLTDIQVVDNQERVTTVKRTLSVNLGFGLKF